MHFIVFLFYFHNHCVELLFKNGNEIHLGFPFSLETLHMPVFFLIFTKYYTHILIKYFPNKDLSDSVSTKNIITAPTDRIYFL